MKVFTQFTNGDYKYISKPYGNDRFVYDTKALFTSERGSYKGWIPHESIHFLLFTLEKSMNRWILIHPLIKFNS